MMQCLKQWEQTHACARRPAEALWLADVGGSMRTRKPIDDPPTTLTQTLNPQCIGYPLSDAQILQLLAICLKAKPMTACGSPSALCRLQAPS